MKFLVSAGVAIAALASPGGASAAVVLVPVNASILNAPFEINFQGVTFTLSATNNGLNPLTVQNTQGGAFSSFGGFLGIPVRPTTFFTDRGSPTFGPPPGGSGAFASFLSPAKPGSSNGNNYIGFRATVGTDNFYGFAFTTGSRLNSYGFETAANTAITATTAVPEPATWAFMILGFGAVGAAMRYRRRRTTSVSFG